MLRDRKSTIKLYGWNIGSPGNPDPFKTPLKVKIDPRACPAEQRHIVVAPTGIDNLLRIPLLEPMEQAEEKTPFEVEQNDTRNGPRTVAAPAAVDGRIKRAGGIDRIALDAKEKERYTLIARANSINSPIDPMLLLVDPAGKELIREVGAGQDIRIDWTAATTGRHIISLSDLNRGGGAEYVYHLDINHATPDCTAKADAPSYRLEAGKSVKVQVTITRLNNYALPLKIEGSDLPPGVTASVPEVT